MKRISIIIIFVLSAICAFSQNVTFAGKTSASVVGVGQRIQVQYDLNQSPSSVELGNISGFKVVGGPSQSTSTSISIVNGRTTQSRTVSYTYVLEAISEGDKTIGAATAVVDGKKYTSNTISVKVQKDPVNQQSRQSSYYDPFDEFFGSSSQSQQRSSSSNQQSASSAQTVGKDDVFIRVNVSKNSLVKGDCLTAVIKLYTCVDLVSITDYKAPSFNNFYAEEIEQTQNTWQREVVNGKTYNVSVLNKYLLYPRMSGSVEIEPAEIKCVARVRTGQRSFWGYVYDNVEVKASSPKVTLNVENLPQAPADFCGAVGIFKINISNVGDSASVNEAISYKVTISGEGNFNVIDAPKLNCPNEFEQYDPVVSQKIKTTDSNMSGSKTWEYTIIPRYGGDFNLGNINFTYFDKNSKSYKTISTDDVVISVRKGADDNTVIREYNSQSGVQYINDEDIRFVKTKLNLVASYVPMVFSGTYFIWITVLLIVFVAIVILMHKKIRNQQDVELMKRKKANKVSRKRLKRANKFMQQGNKTEFYKEIIRALWGYASDKLGIPTANLTKDNVSQAFAERNVNEELARNFLNLIETCEFAHFVSAQDDNEMQNIYRDTVKVIELLEENIK